MKLENLKKIRKDIGLEISDSVHDLGTDKMFELCFIQTRLDRLIRIIEQPDYLKKINKSMNLGVKHG